MNLKKALLSLLLLSAMVGVDNLKAQVTFGTDKEPDKGALLNLKENGDGTSAKGLFQPGALLTSLDALNPLEAYVKNMYTYNTEEVQACNRQ